MMAASKVSSEKYAMCLKDEINKCRGEIMGKLLGSMHETCTREELDKLANTKRSEDVETSLTLMNEVPELKGVVRQIRQDALKIHLGLIVQYHHQELLNEFADKDAKWLRELLYREKMISEAERNRLANCKHMIDHSKTVVDIMIRRDSIEYVVSMLRFLRTNGFSFSSDMISDVQRRYKELESAGDLEAIRDLSNAPGKRT